MRDFTKDFLIFITFIVKIVRPLFVLIRYVIALHLQNNSDILCCCNTIRNVSVHKYDLKWQSPLFQIDKIADCMETIPSFIIVGWYAAVIFFVMFPPVTSRTRDSKNSYSCDFYSDISTSNNCTAQQGILIFFCGVCMKFNISLWLSMRVSAVPASVTYKLHNIESLRIWHDIVSLWTFQSVTNQENEEQIRLNWFIYSGLLNKSYAVCSGVSQLSGRLLGDDVRLEQYDHGEWKH